MILVFMLKWAVALTLLYSLYGLFLSKETFYTVNRCVLLSIIVISAVLPFIHVTTEHQSVVNDAVENVSQQLVLRPKEAQDADGGVSYAALVVLIIYIGGLVAMIGRYLLSLLSVLNILRNSKRENDCYINNNVESPFSWFNYIVISRADLERNGKAMLAHERVHARRGHSYDLLFCDICCCLQWFNPFVWMLKEDLCAVHEYEADYGVTHCEGIDYHDYQMLLIDKATEKQVPGIVNSINRSSLKHRMKQMYRKPSSKRALLKVLYVLPLSLLVMYAFASPQTAAKVNSVATSAVEALESAERTIADYAKESIEIESPESTEKAEAKDVDDLETLATEYADIVDDPDISPQYNGGADALVQYLTSNIQYPSIARRCGVEGRIVVGFIVEADGSLSGAEVLSNMSSTHMAVVSGDTISANEGGYIEEDDFNKAKSALEEEALRLIKSMPRWMPGVHEGRNVRTEMLQPVYFNLNE